MKSGEPRSWAEGAFGWLTPLTGLVGGSYATLGLLALGVGLIAAILITLSGFGGTAANGPAKPRESDSLEEARETLEHDADVGACRQALEQINVALASRPDDQRLRRRSESPGSAAKGAGAERRGSVGSRRRQLHPPGRLAPGGGLPVPGRGGPCAGTAGAGHRPAAAGAADAAGPGGRRLRLGGARGPAGADDGHRTDAAAVRRAPGFRHVPGTRPRLPRPPRPAQRDRPETLPARRTSIRPERKRRSRTRPARSGPSRSATPPSAWTARPTRRSTT